MIFLHIPKTAGTTLHDILDRHYPPESIYSIGAIAHESMAGFKDLDEQDRNKSGCCAGIWAYGLHEHLPGPAKYFTILRDPVARVISLL